MKLELTREQRRKVRSAYDRLMRLERSYVYILHNLEFYPCRHINGWPIETAATDGYRIYYNPDYMDAETVDVMVFTLLHEVMHVKGIHHARRGERDPEKWNIATDLRINRIIEVSNALTKYQFPTSLNVLMDPQGKYDGLSAERVYDLLPDPPKEGGDQSGDQSDDQSGDGPTKPSQSNGGPGDVMSPEDSGVMAKGEMDPGKETRRVQRISANAEARADREEAEANPENGPQNSSGGTLGRSKAGSGKGGPLRRTWNRMTAPILDWEEEIMNLFGPLHPMTQSWNVLHRGMFANGHDYPGLKWERGIRKAGVLIDVSYSMDEVALSKVNHQFTAMAQEYRPEEIVVVYCSTDVRRVDRFLMGEDPTFNATGGGGTRMDPGFRRLMEEVPDADFFICFTDLELPRGDLQYQHGKETLFISTGLSEHATESKYGKVLKI